MGLCGPAGWTGTGAALLCEAASESSLLHLQPWVRELSLGLSRLEAAAAPVSVALFRLGAATTDSPPGTESELPGPEKLVAKGTLIKTLCVSCEAGCGI